MKNEPFSDIDEIEARYITPMNDFVASVLEHRAFRAGTPEQVR